MKISKFSFFIVVILALISCSSDTLSYHEYQKWLDNSKEVYTKVVQTTTINYEFKVLPPEAIALRAALDGEKGVDMGVYQKRYQDVKDYWFVTIKLVNNKANASVLQTGVTSMADVEQRTSYYNFAAKNDLRCICGNDTLYPVDYAFEENYNLSNYAVINAVFPKCGNDDMVIRFDDQAYNNPNLFAKLSLKKFPKLHF